jgi:hypothetical protein
MIFEEVLDRLLTLYTSDEYSDEILKAKVEFFERSVPSVDDDTAQFNLRMSQFLDWYLFSRKLTGPALSPIEYALQDKQFPKRDSDTEHFKSLLNATHSVFEYLKSKDNDIYIRDLFSGNKIVVKNSEVNAGFNKDDVFSVRIIPHGDSYVFAKGFCFHPPEARKYILKEIKLHKNTSHEEKEKLLLKLLRMKNKVDQYKHILPKFIYTNENAFRV